LTSDIRTLAAGVICVGFEGTKIDGQLASQLEKTPFAGIILFARNTETLAQTRALTDRIRELLDQPIIAIDQEGGRVTRLRDGVEELPAMLALAATGDEELAQRAGAQIAFDLRRAGVNVDFAPVLDLAIFPQNTAIGARAFGDNPEIVANLAGAVARGLRSRGIAATFKHFPGHGSTAVDSHLDLPVIEIDEATYRARDLVPFIRLLPGAEAVMTAHIIVQTLDPQLPATLSPRILTDLLRKEAGFRGVCFTDCMQMDAIAKGIGTAPGAVQALIAGADCVLISHSVELALEVIQRIVDAVEAGALSRERLQEAYERVRSLRAGLSLPLPIEAAPPYSGIGREIGRRAVTLIRGTAPADAGNSVILSFEGTTMEGVQGLHSYHPSLGSGIPQVRIPLDPQEVEVDAALAALRRLEKRPIVLARRAHVYPAQAAAIERVLQAFPGALLISTREPFDAFLFPKAADVVATYGDDAPSMAGLADVIFGGVPAQGRFPLHLNPELIQGGAR
jgi:beta-N-acetylhexosaminidase